MIILSNWHFLISNKSSLPPISTPQPIVVIKSLMTWFLITCSIGAFKQFNVLPLTGSNAWNLLSRAFLQLPRAESAIQHADYILNHILCSPSPFRFARTSLPKILLFITNSPTCSLTCNSLYRFLKYKISNFPRDFTPVSYIAMFSYAI